MSKKAESKEPEKVRVLLKGSVRLSTLAVGLPGPDVRRWLGPNRIVEMSAETFEEFKATHGAMGYEVLTGE